MLTHVRPEMPYIRKALRASLTRKLLSPRYARFAEARFEPFTIDETVSASGSGRLGRLVAAGRITRVAPTASAATVAPARARMERGAWASRMNCQTSSPENSTCRWA
jgi:hypothetical protein